MTVMHPRQAIRHALRDHLGAPVPDTDPPVHRTAAGARVFLARSLPVPAEQLPAILVFTPADARDLAWPIHDNGPVRRILTLMVEASAAGDDADDTVDLVCIQVERALRLNPALGGLVESLRWHGTVLEPGGQGEGGVVTARMTWQAVYYTLPPPEPDGVVPVAVYGSWAPEIGPPHADDYDAITDGRIPEIDPP